MRVWTLPCKRNSAWLTRARIIAGVCLVGWAFSLLVVAITEWWASYIWQWPLLLYASYIMHAVNAPLWPESHLILNDSGQFAQGAEHIQFQQALVTPFMIAAQVRMAQKPSTEWVWFIRDQFDLQSWARIRRICRQLD